MIFRVGLESIKKILRNCPNHDIPRHIQVYTFYHGLTDGGKDKLDHFNGDSFLPETTIECHNLLNNVVANHYEKKSKCATTLKKKKLSLEETLMKFMASTVANFKTMEIQVGQLANVISSRPQGSLLSNIEPNPRQNSKAQCQAVTLHNGRELQKVVKEPAKIKGNEVSSEENEKEVEVPLEVTDYENKEDLEAAKKLDASKFFKTKGVESLENPAPSKVLKPLIEESPNLELKPLLNHLRYAYLGESDSLPVIISSSLSDVQVEKLLRVLRDYKDFSKISKSLCNLLEKDVPYKFHDTCLHAFNKLRGKLLPTPITIVLDWALLFKLMYDARTKNQIVDHLSRLESPAKTDEPNLINDNFPYEQLLAIVAKDVPWYDNIVNYLTRGIIPFDRIHNKRKDKPFLFKQYPDIILRRCVPKVKINDIIEHKDRTAAKILQLGFYWPNLFKDAYSFVANCDRCQRIGNISKKHKMPLNTILKAKLFDIWGIDFVEASTVPNNDSKVVINFIKKNIFTQFDQWTS
ncbi:hypothetical protein CDL12_27103 [Handroanthus impetiginosus]|uniref:Integrase zinc-binding domain-containing protein n=1 Tax=Handroanthus impetiginosus TaxID=429701 RepID=A0A2G9G511_9LAMI|nr:hypothetical protein CDL12_27103 [Handroanthus impetiginosus]